MTLTHQAKCWLAVLATALGAAGPSGRPAPLTAFNLPLSSISGISMLANDSCDVAGTRKRPVGKVVRLHLTPALLNHLIDGTASSYIYLDATAPSTTPKQYGGESVDDDSNQQPGSLSLASDPRQSLTRLDINLMQGGNALWQSDGAGGYKPILIKIILEGTSLTFIGQSPGGDSSQAIQTDTATAARYPNMFDCRQPIQTQTVGGITRSSIQFRVNRTSGGAVGSLNIGIIANECNGALPCFLMPLVLDPKVPNSG